MMQFPLKQEGTVIGNEEIFPEGVNVEVVWIQDAGHLWMRVWERGCGETFACGTGACAAVAAAMRQKKMRCIRAGKNDRGRASGTI